MATEAEALLHAEMAADKLLEDLEKLRQQVGGYGRARAELEAVRADAQRLLTEVAALVGRAREVISTMSVIGTPELLSRVESAKAASQSAANTAQSAREAAERAVEALRNSAASAHSESEAVKRAIAESVHASRQGQLDLGAMVAAKVADESKTIRAAVGKATTLVTVAVVSAGVSALCAGGTLAFLLFRTTH